MLTRAGGLRDARPKLRVSCFRVGPDNAIGDVMSPKSGALQLRTRRGTVRPEGLQEVYIKSLEEVSSFGNIIRQTTQSAHVFVDIAIERRAPGACRGVEQMLGRLRLALLAHPPGQSWRASLTGAIKSRDDSQLAAVLGESLDGRGPVLLLASVSSAGDADTVEVVLQMGEAIENAAGSSAQQPAAAAPDKSNPKSAHDMLSLLSALEVSAHNESRLKAKLSQIETEVEAAKGLQGALLSEVRDLKRERRELRVVAAAAQRRATDRHADTLLSRRHAEPSSARGSRHSARDTDGGNGDVSRKRNGRSYSAIAPSEGDSSNMETERMLRLRVKKMQGELRDFKLYKTVIEGTIRRQQEVSRSCESKVGSLTKAVAKRDAAIRRKDGQLESLQKELQDALRKLEHTAGRAQFMRPQAAAPAGAPALASTVAAPPARGGVSRAEEDRLRRALQESQEDSWRLGADLKASRSETRALYEAMSSGFENRNAACAAAMELNRKLEEKLKAQEAHLTDSTMLVTEIGRSFADFAVEAQMPAMAKDISATAHVELTLQQALAKVARAPAQTTKNANVGGNVKHIQESLLREGRHGDIDDLQQLTDYLRSSAKKSPGTSTPRRVPVPGPTTPEPTLPLSPASAAPPPIRPLSIPSRQAAAPAPSQPLAASPPVEDTARRPPPQFSSPCAEIQSVSEDEDDEDEFTEMRKRFDMLALIENSKFRKLMRKHDDSTVFFSCDVRADLSGDSEKDMIFVVSRKHVWLLESPANTTCPVCDATSLCVKHLSIRLACKVKLDEMEALHLAKEDDDELLLDVLPEVKRGAMRLVSSMRPDIIETCQERYAAFTAKALQSRERSGNLADTLRTINERKAALPDVDASPPKEKKVSVLFPKVSRPAPPSLVQPQHGGRLSSSDRTTSIPGSHRFVSGMNGFRDPETVASIVLGIRESTSAEPIDMKPVDGDDFKERRRIVFVPEGQDASSHDQKWSDEIAHSDHGEIDEIFKLSKEKSKPDMKSFKFKEYAPNVFRDIRERSGITNADYVESICCEKMLCDMSTNSKSGSIFFYTPDMKYVIKSAAMHEKRFLVGSKKDIGMLQKYHAHLTNVPDSFITRIVGMYHIELKAGKLDPFIVMVNVFPGDLAIQEVYDLKGSSYGREAKPHEKAVDTDPSGHSKCILKDNDFRQSKTFIWLDKARKREFLRVFRKDAECLREMGAIDYSLLLGVHHRDRVAPGGPGLTDEDASTQEPGVLRRLDGGVSAMPVPGDSSSNVMFYMGIIDILESYTTKKKLEKNVRGKAVAIKAPKGLNDLSVTDPTSYSKRFVSFIEEKTREA